MLRPQPLPPVPVETARVARAALSPNHPYLRLADELGDLFADAGFADLFPAHGQPALAPWRLALTTILQFAEGLSDRQAAQAIRSRIDWKYVLRLELDDGGFDGSVLSEFRGRLLAHDAATRLFDTLLAWCRERGVVKARGRQRTDSTYVWSAVRGLNRLELVVEAMRYALNTLAAADPAWLHGQARAEWVDRYARRADRDRLPDKPAAREALALAVGADGYALLQALRDPDAPPWLREIPAAAMLRLVWLQNYTRTDAEVRWRTEQETPPAARFISSPYDEDVHLAFRRNMHWIGYKIHLTEACDDDRPPLIIHVETTTAPVADGDVTPVIHAALQEEELLPREHVVDTGYLDAALLVSSRREYGVDLVGPTRLDYHWQAQERTGFALEHFQIDWANQQAICPEGHISNSWTPAVDRRDNQVIKVKFSGRDCRRCPSCELCTRSTKKYPRRTITIRAREEFDALLAARRRVRTGEYARTYARRAGCEGTLSRGVRRCRLRRTRYVGQERVHLGHVLSATGLNFVRLGEWLAGTPRAKARSAPFATLMGGSPPL
ncbi:MAG TPA: IS1182 family transposase [Chloroflexota bacterium]|jgi:transposase